MSKNFCLFCGTKTLGKYINRAHKGNVCKACGMYTYRNENGEILSMWDKVGTRISCPDGAILVLNSETL